MTATQPKNSIVVHIIEYSHETGSYEVEKLPVEVSKITEKTIIQCFDDNGTEYSILTRVHPNVNYFCKETKSEILERINALKNEPPMER